MCFPKHLGIAWVAHPRYCTLLVNFGCSSATQGRRWKGANWPLVYNTGYKTHDLNCLLVLLSFLIFTSSHLAAIDLNVYLAQLSHIWLNCLMDMQIFNTMLINVVSRYDENWTSPVWEGPWGHSLPPTVIHKGHSTRSEVWLVVCNCSDLVWGCWLVYVDLHPECVDTWHVDGKRWKRKPVVWRCLFEPVHLVQTGQSLQDWFLTKVKSW